MSQDVAYFSSVVKFITVPAFNSRSASPSVFPVRISGPATVEGLAQPNKRRRKDELNTGSAQVRVVMEKMVAVGPDESKVFRTRQDMTGQDIPLVSRAMATGLPIWDFSAALALSMTDWWYSYEP